MRTDIRQFPRHRDERRSRFAAILSKALRPVSFLTPTGTVTPGPDGTFTYLNSGGLAPGAEDSWDYRVIDGEGGESWATVTIRINTVPVAGDDLIDAHEDDVEVTDSLLGNDTDADGDDLSVTPIDVVLTDGLWTIGRIVVDAAGTHTLTLDEGLQALNDGDSVSATFSYEVDDGFGGTDSADVLVTVEGQNDVEAVDDEFSGMAVEAAPPATLGNVIDNDAGSDLMVTSVNGVPVGTGASIGVTDGTAGEANMLVFADGRVDLEVVVPFATDVSTSFTYTVADGFGNSDTASVDVSIYGNVDLAQDDEFFADGLFPYPEPQPIGNVLTNDVQGVSIVSADGREMVDSIDIFVTEEGGLGLGVITIESNGDVTFTVLEPFLLIKTTRTFWYTVGDGLRTEPALVTVNIFGDF